MDVPQRDHILIHAGNTHKDTQGCILLGVQFGRLGSDSAILASRVAMKQFMQMMKGVKEAELLVVDSYGGGRVH
jgi:hypothetical protein